MAVGGGISAYAAYQSDMEQADAARQNAAYYEKQAEYSQEATDREMDIFSGEVEDLLSRQVSAYGRSGVDLSGSPLLLIGQTKEKAREQLAAIEEKGRQTRELAFMRANTSWQEADDLERGAPLRFFGGLLSTGGSLATRAAPKTGNQSFSSAEWEDTGSGTAVRTKNSTTIPTWEDYR